MRLRSLWLVPILLLLGSPSLSAWANGDSGDAAPASTPAPLPTIEIPANAGVDEYLTRRADPVDAEREALALIAHELVALKAEVRDASRSAPTMARVQFRYDWLESDLDMVERAIRDHLDAPRQPRNIVPLKGDYRY